MSLSVSEFSRDVAITCSQSSPIISNKSRNKLAFDIKYVNKRIKHCI